LKNKLIILFGLFVFSLSFFGCRFNNTSDVESIAIKTEPTKTTYLVSEKFDPTGLVITATFGDNSTEDITYSEDSGITFKNSKFTTSGEKEITVVYCEKETTLKITVKPTLKSIEVKTEPTKLVYAVEDSFDPSGLVITATYSNSTTEDITYATDSGITLSTPDMTAEGDKTITVTYLEKETSFNITVKPVVKSITVKTNPTKATYTIDEKFDPAGLVITATYSNSTTEDITYSATSGITLSTPDMTAEGDKTITVTYLEKTASFTIAVQKKVEKIYKIDTATAVTKNNWFVEAIDVYAFGNKTVNISISAKMKVTNTGATANVTWATNADGSYPTLASSSFAKGTSDWVTVTGTKENVKLSQYPKIYISPYGLTAANLTIYVTEITVTITEASTSKTYTAFTSKDGLSEITATDVPAAYTPPVVLTSISVKTKPTKSLYEISDTALNLTGLVITETYDDGTTTDVTYSSTAGITTSSVDFSTTGTKTVTVTYKEKTATFTINIVDGTNWLSSSVPSLKDKYADQFDYIGIAAEYGNFGLQQNGSNKYTATYTHSGWGTPTELYYEEIQNGIAKHANSITLGNELKPQFLLQWWSGDGSDQTMVDFTASNGKTIQVPDSLNGEKLIYATLNVCKKMNVQMRGHVLTWHSQTPDGFFAVGYKPTYSDSTKNTITNLVDADTMTARHEWYIKTVLGCVAAWEEANSYQAIWAWDVVNEAMADDAGKTYTGTSQNWLRGSTDGTKDKAPDNGGGSRWYQVYGNEEFIVNAFRFANAYAPTNVKLCYNDYNEYWDAAGHYKTSAIEHIVQVVKAGSAQTVNGNSVSPRIDVIAMQSHVGVSWPGVSGYEAALTRFLALADVHVSELDFSAETQAAAKTCYNDYFTMLQKYGKKSTGTHKVTNVTIWGINNEYSWINPASSGGKKTYPLLFNIVDNVSTTTKEVTYDTGVETLPRYDVGDTYVTNDAFWAVIDAHKTE